MAPILLGTAMNEHPPLHPHVYPTGDGERSTAGSNYGDWRPAQPHGPHGYDFEERFPPPELDPDFRRPREAETPDAASPD